MLLRLKLTLQPYKPVVFNGSEIAPGGDFMRYGGDFVS